MPSNPLGGAAVASLLAALTAPDEFGPQALKKQFRDAIAKDPMDTTLKATLLASALFYAAEKGHNPKVERFEDALVFITTCLSVGYANTFAVTPTGKFLASAVMTFGPSMVAKLLDPPKGQAEETDNQSPIPKEQLINTSTSPELQQLLNNQTDMVEKLDKIVRELQRLYPVAIRS